MLADPNHFSRPGNDPYPLQPTGVDSGIEVTVREGAVVYGDIVIAAFTDAIRGTNITGPESAMTNVELAGLSAAAFAAVGLFGVVTSADGALEDQKCRVVTGFETVQARIEGGIDATISAGTGLMADLTGNNDGQLIAHVAGSKCIALAAQDILLDGTGKALGYVRFNGTYGFGH